MAENGNTAAMRCWLKTIRNMSEHNENDLGNPVVRGLLDQLTRIHTCAREALSAPPRNCDAMTSSEAKLAWGEYRHSVPLPHGGWTAEHVIDWMYATAEGGAE